MIRRSGRAIGRRSDCRLHGGRLEADAALRFRWCKRLTEQPTDQPAVGQVVEGSGGLLLEIDGQVVPNYDATLTSGRGGRSRHRPSGAHRQGRGARRHRLQVRGRHPLERALDPQVRRPARRGPAGRRGRRDRPHQGGPGRPADRLQEARALREGVAAHRGGGAHRRVRRGHGDRGRQGRPHHRPRHPRLPAGLARRHPPRAEPRPVPGNRRSKRR